MNTYWNPGDVVALRWIAQGHLRIAQPIRVVKDGPEETALLMLPGSICYVPEWVWREGVDERSIRWANEREGATVLRAHIWHTNRTLMLLYPNRFYSIIHFWNDSTIKFECYYINFQLPFRRSPCEFDTYDLELDLVIDPSLTWEWKDVDAYNDGVFQGNIRPQWVEAIDRAKAEVLTMVRERAYPFDGRWINFRHPLGWTIPTLPARWDELS